MLEIKNIYKTFNPGTINEKVALNGLSLKLNEGDFVTVIGGNGAGKSTMLNAVAGVWPVDEGQIIIDGTDVTKLSEYKRAAYLGRVFQDPMTGTAATMGIEENLALAKRRGKTRLLRPGITKAERAEYKELLKILNLGLEDRLTSKVGLLSGGQRQALTLLMATLQKPKLLLLDEPFAAIDAKIRTELRSWLKDMIEKLGITSIFVTHDQDEAIEVADEIIITNRGRIEQKGTPLEVYQNPDTAFTAGFFGQTSVIDDYQVFNHFEEVPGGEKAIVRPEFVKVTKKNEEQKYKSSATEGIVERVAFRGSSLELKVRVGNTTLSARRSLDEEPVREGEVVDVFVQRIFVTKGNEAVLLHNTAMVEDWFIYVKFSHRNILQGNLPDHHGFFCGHFHPKT